jgi:hypothetical protein
MLKSILTSAIIIALILGISYSNVAQPTALKIDNNTGEEATIKVNSIDATSPFNSADVDNTEKRVESQVQRYVRDYNLTEQQKKDLIAILTNFETQSSEIRIKLNSLSKEKNDKIDALLTDEQKQMKGQAEKDRRNKLIEKRNTEKMEADKQGGVKPIAVPQKKK